MITADSFHRASIAAGTHEGTHGDTMKVEVTKTERLFDGFFKLDRAVLRHKTPDGTMSPEVVRLNVERGDGAAVLLVNRDRNTVILIRQFRYATWLRGDGGWILEIPAGTVTTGHTPARVARNELLEEVGYRATRLRRIMRFYSTPGTTTERTHLFYAEVRDRHKVASGGGLDSEHEFIETIECPIARALRMLDRGEVFDAKTIVALQWLKAQKTRRTR
jgi:nudix-type nucleoside diphosphatase (YffH/AdpP family)